MNSCPKCGANVEGLIRHCDCCGAPLNLSTAFFTCSTVEFPCDFGHRASEIISKAESIDTSEYQDFLTKISFYFYCVPKFLADRENIKNEVCYSRVKKHAEITVLVDYVDYVYEDEDNETYTSAKERMVTIVSSIQQGIHSLEEHLAKRNLSINNLVKAVDQTLADT